MGDSQENTDGPGSARSPTARSAYVTATTPILSPVAARAVAVSWAEILGAGKIYIGAVEQDSSGYPDCRPAYYRAFNEVIRQGTKEGHIEVVTPLITLRKHEIVRLGLELGAPLDLTWSCYSREDRACGVCDSCVLRLRAFQDAAAYGTEPGHVALARNRRDGAVLELAAELRRQGNPARVVILTTFARGGYLRRVSMYIQASIFLALDIFLQTTDNLRRDGQLWKARSWTSALRTWLGRDGIFWHLLIPSLRYLAPSFHPWQHDNRRLASRWLDEHRGAFRSR